MKDVRAYDLFAPKCAENKILAADLKRAVEIPSRSILFNIDQKADVIAKTQTDALLGVFQKVFDELSGYYGKQPHIAQFERDLDSRNILVAFKMAYAEIARKALAAWTRTDDPRRRQYREGLLRSHRIAGERRQQGYSTDTGKTTAPRLRTLPTASRRTWMRRVRNSD